MAKTTHNKSLDVRAKQRLSYHVAWLLSACVNSISPHVNSAVIDESDYSAYFAKQPETSEEEKQCREAMNCCPVKAILDNGESKNQ